MSEWNPGDVAVARHPITDGLVRGIIDRDGRFYTTDQSVIGISSSAFALSALRPLVVIDPEDDEQVERLLTLVDEWASRVPYEDMRKPGDLTGESALANALREFARPTPAKPEEPTGLGAVVEDWNGRKWVRVYGEADQPDYDCWKPDVLMTRTRYSEVAAVRVLSPGVEATP